MTAAETTASDPVCGMTVNPKAARGVASSTPARRTISATRGAASGLAPKTARRLQANGEEDVPLDAVQIGKISSWPGCSIRSSAFS